jgi:hypothetical protein
MRLLQLVIPNFALIVCLAFTGLSSAAMQQDELALTTTGHAATSPPMPPDKPVTMTTTVTQSVPLVETHDGVDDDSIVDTATKTLGQGSYQIRIDVRAVSSQIHTVVISLTKRDRP